MSVKICKTCQHYRPYRWYQRLSYYYTPKHMCAESLYDVTDLVTGKVSTIGLIECYDNRRCGAKCGKLGKLYKETRYE